jgi:hypothetical protein
VVAFCIADVLFGLFCLHFSLLGSPNYAMAATADIPENAANGPGLSHRNTDRSPSTPDADYDVYPPLALKPTQLLFAGRLGGNQEFIINRDDPAQAALLQKTPDAAPFISLAQTFDLRGFREVDLWKAAFVEAIGESFQHLKA